MANNGSSAVGIAGRLTRRTFGGIGRGDDPGPKEGLACTNHGCGCGVGHRWQMAAISDGTGAGPLEIPWQKIKGFRRLFYLSLLLLPEATCA